MKTSKLTKLAILVIFVITASILETLLGDYIESFVPSTGTYLAILIDMLILIFVFIPILTVLEPILEKISKSYVETSKKLGGTRRKGLIIGFIIIFIILFIAYAYVNHDFNVIQDLQKKF